MIYIKSKLVKFIYICFGAEFRRVFHPFAYAWYHVCRALQNQGFSIHKYKVIGINNNLYADVFENFVSFLWVIERFCLFISNLSKCNLRECCGTAKVLCDVHHDYIWIRRIFGQMLASFPVNSCVPIKLNFHLSLFRAVRKVALPKLLRLTQ